jgi:predicted nucleotide-binding protein
LPASEWAAAFAADPTGFKEHLLPVLVRPCKPSGLLAAVVHIDLTGLDSEAARTRLLARVKKGRSKPTRPPIFPGDSLRRAPPRRFPGSRPLEEPKAALIVSVEDLIEQLSKRIVEGEELILPIGGANEAVFMTDEWLLQDLRGKFRTWDEFNKTLLEISLSTDKFVQEYVSMTRPIEFGRPPSPQRQFRHIQEDIKEKVRRLRSITERLPLYEQARKVDPIGSRAASSRMLAQDTDSPVFLAHGRDAGLTQEVARFLELVTGNAPLVLEDMPDEGRTVVEKFEYYAAIASFALILLTSDDKSALSASGRRVSAAQNLILELGFFVSALSRNRVAVLHDEDLVLPSDVHGFLCIPFDRNGAWRLPLARGLAAAGLKVDLHRIL